MTDITTKKTMYEMLSWGAFGNTIPQYFSVKSWIESGDSARFKLWGVRSATVPAHPKCLLNCPTYCVAEYADEHFGQSPNISMMVDAVAEVTAWLEIFDSTSGLIVEGIEHPDTAGGWDWRNSMNDLSRRKRWEMSEARAVLARHLNANSRNDVEELLGQFPEHVIELSALNRCLGSVPHRNAVIWEVRMY